MTEHRRRAVLALGSNQGDRLATLQGAVDALADTPGLAVLAVSPVYETDPVGGPEQPDYLNAVVLVDGDLAAARPAGAGARGRGRPSPGCATCGGARGRSTSTWSPSVTCGVDEPDLVVPHPRAAERAFVLVPWLDVDPEAVLPGAGRVADLARRAGPDRCAARDDLVLVVPGAVT